MSKVNSFNSKCNSVPTAKLHWSPPGARRNARPNPPHCFSTEHWHQTAVKVRVVYTMCYFCYWFSLPAFLFIVEKKREKKCAELLREGYPFIMIACYSGSRRCVSIRSGRWGMQSGTHCTSAKLPATTVSLHLVHLQDDSWVSKEEGRKSESGNLEADWLNSWRQCRILAWSSPFRLEILCQRACSRISGSLPFNSSNLDFFF